MTARKLPPSFRSRSPAGLAIRPASSVEDASADRCFLKPHRNDGVALWLTWALQSLLLPQRCGLEPETSCWPSVCVCPAPPPEQGPPDGMPWVRREPLRRDLHAPAGGSSECRADASLASGLKSLGKESQVPAHQKSYLLWPRADGVGLLGVKHLCLAMSTFKLGHDSRKPSCRLRRARILEAAWGCDRQGGGRDHCGRVSCVRASLLRLQ